MEFKKKLKTRLYISVSYMVLGAFLILLDCLTRFENHFYTAFGAALIFMGIARLIQHRRITRNEKSMRNRELAESDERLIMLSERARSWAFSFSVMVAGIVVIVLSLLGKQDAAQPFAWYVCAQVFLYWIFWFYLHKKY